MSYDQIILTRKQRIERWGNPKHEPLARRRRSTEYRPYISHYAMKSKRDFLGNIIPNRFVRFWGGRDPSKYNPVDEAKKHGKE